MFSANVENSRSDQTGIKVQRFRLTYGRSAESSPGAHASAQIFHPQRKTFLRRVCPCVCVWAASVTSPVKLSSWQLQAADQRTSSGLCSRMLLEKAAEKKRSAGTGVFSFVFYVGGFCGGWTAEWACRPPPALSSQLQQQQKESGGCYQKHEASP